jgi:hypothetical protein
MSIRKLPYQGIVVTTVLIIVTLFAVRIRSASSSTVISSEYYNLSIPPIALTPDESIYGFTLNTAGAVIVRLRSPLQWNFSLDNSLGGRSVLIGKAITGSSALENSYFHNFVQIAQINSAPVSLPFKVNIILSITNDRTGDQRRVRLGTAQLILTKSAPDEYWRHAS